MSYFQRTKPSSSAIIASPRSSFVSQNTKEPMFGPLKGKAGNGSGGGIVAAGASLLAVGGAAVCFLNNKNANAEMETQLNSSILTIQGEIKIISSRLDECLNTVSLLSESVNEAKAEIEQIKNSQLGLRFSVSKETDTVHRKIAGIESSLKMVCASLTDIKNKEDAANLVIMDCDKNTAITPVSTLATSRSEGTEVVSNSVVRTITELSLEKSTSKTTESTVSDEEFEPDEEFEDALPPPVI